MLIFLLLCYASNAYHYAIKNLIMLNIMLKYGVQRSPQSQPHSAHMTERVNFSDLKNSFKESQSQSLEDYIELSLMLQYNRN